MTDPDPEEMKRSFDKLAKLVENSEAGRAILQGLAAYVHRVLEEQRILRMEQHQFRMSRRIMGWGGVVVSASAVAGLLLQHAMTYQSLLLAFQGTIWAWVAYINFRSPG